MAEVRIKIQSDPYQEKVQYYSWHGYWREITTSTNPGSGLLGERLVRGFFPFKAEEIVETISKEFGDGGRIQLVFEGSDDEWQELKSICSDGPCADSFDVERSERYLANARDVLPEIIEVFREIQPLVDDAVSERRKVSEQITKFVDVSSDVIPLCVLGNYSAGKSTFINALIGMEILPNGDEPVTARVFQIRRSKDRDRATIQFSFGDRHYLLRFDLDGLMENRELNGDPFYDDLSLRTTQAGTGMAVQMNGALKVINSHRQSGDGRRISDLIRIEVPFSDTDPWPHDREFVIFDTPGSNSASNEDHARVLKEAMEGLSNGLPIFVAEYSSLDSTDNANLYQEIEQIPAIDERFAMIAVNKADSADLPKGGFDDDEITQIMHWSIPSNLYGQGIYFVSSILGLGAKNSGEFISDNYAEKFEDQQRKYVDPSSRFYKTLYRYDILPGQIGRRADRESETCKDLLLANSGLFCIENEIRLFAERYSAYNKCSRSESLLQEIIDITEQEIDGKKKVVESQKKKREEQLEQDKQELIERLEACCFDEKRKSADEYDDDLDGKIDAGSWLISSEALNERQQDITENERENLAYAQRSDEAEEARRSVLPRFVDRLGDSFKNDGAIGLADHVNRVADGLKSTTQGLLDDTRDALNKRSDVAKTRKEADRNAADQLFDEVVSDYNDRASRIMRTVDEESQSYLKSCAERSRQELYRIATNDDAPLSEEKRKEVGEIIINYRGLELDNVKGPIFNKAAFHEIKFGNQVIFKRDKLFLNKVKDRFNKEIKGCLTDTRDEIGRRHIEGFNVWLNELLNQVESNITDYNPVLHGYVEEINQQIAQIDVLEARLGILKDRRDYVAHVIDWRD